MVLIDGILEGLNTLKDGSVKVVFVSQELTPETAGRLYGIRNTYCVAAIKSEGYSDEELKALEDFDSEFKVRGKSLSQQLRNALYVWHQQDPQGYDTFDRFYEHYMNQFIEHVKGKLND